VTNGFSLKVKLITWWVKAFSIPPTLRTAKAGTQPDPLVGIFDFQRQLQARGIKLIVMPVPAKASIHPDKMSARAPKAPTNTQQLAENASFARFEAELRAGGVLVYNPAATLLRQRYLTGQAQFMPADTHWTPQAMTSVARDLASFINANIELPKRKPTRYTLQTAYEKNIPDLELMLNFQKTRTFSNDKALRYNEYSIIGASYGNRKLTPTFCCWAIVSPTFTRTAATGAERLDWANT
jgi:hypothetical protein